MTTTSGITGTSGTTTTSTTVKDQTTVDKDTFLKLLVAQMKYQDPSSPTDPSQFLSQTAQFSTVEKLSTLADLSQKAFDATRELTATSMIGRTVTWTDVSGKSVSGVATGASVGASTPNLTVGGKTVTLDSVTGVDDGTTAATPTPTG